VIDQSTIDKIFDAAEIVQIVEEFVPLKKRGVNYLGLCPFHNEKTPSFTVSPAKGIYKCFGCGKGGNSVNFIMEHENLNYVDALKFVARKYHIEIEEKEESEEEKGRRDERESLMIVTEYAGKYFADQLINRDEGKAVGLSYLKERGFRHDIIEKFHLGYSPDNKDAFTKAALSKGYKIDFLVSTGLTIKKDDWQIDRFNGRVIFPIHNIAGRIIAFGGRTLKSDKKIAKYLNSPESEIYHKSKVLYGIYQAKRDIIKEDKCYLVEGYTDVISFHQNGISNVVASSGTSLTVEQIRLIKRFTPNITILYDGDAAGVKASMRGIDLILAEGLNVKILLFPEDEDPDSFSKSHSSRELVEFIEKNEEDFIGFKTQILKKDANNDPVKLSLMIRDIVGSIAHIPDKIKRSVFIKECSNNLEIGEDILYAEVTKILRKKREKKLQQQYNSQQDISVVRKRSNQRQSVQNKHIIERHVIRLLIKHGNAVLFEEETDNGEKVLVTVAEFITNEIENEKETYIFEDTVNRDIYDLISSHIDNGIFNESVLINHPDQAINSLVADILSSNYNLSGIWTKKENFVETEENVLHELVPETIMAFKKIKVELLLKEKEESLKEPMSDEKLFETLTIIKNLKKIDFELSIKLGFRAIT